MSHITKIQTSFRDLEVLSEACRELGLQLEMGENLMVRDYYGNQIAVVARVPLGQYALGFTRQADGTLAIAADFWGIAKYADSLKVRQACAGITGSVDEIQIEAQGRLAKLFDRPYRVASQKKVLRTDSRYRGFQMEEVRNSQGEVERLVVTRRVYR